MTQTAQPWKPLLHGPLERLEDNLWSIAAQARGMALRRRMTIVKLADGRLVLWSAVPLAEPAQRELEAWGEPAFIVVPNGFHRHGAPLYKARYPNAQVLCGDAVRARVAKVVEVAGNLELLPRDPTLRALTLAGCAHGEQALVVQSGARATLVLNDAVFNHPHAAGVDGFFMRVIGSTGGPRITFIARTLMIRDEHALREQLETLAATPGLARIVVSHVDLITHNPGGLLRDLAATL